MEPERGPRQRVAGCERRCLLGVVCLRVQARRWLPWRRGGGAGGRELRGSPAITTALAALAAPAALATALAALAAALAAPTALAVAIAALAALAAIAALAATVAYEGPRLWLYGEPVDRVVRAEHGVRWYGLQQQ